MILSGLVVKDAHSTWLGTRLNIDSVSLSNTKRLLSDCLQSFMQRVGSTNVCLLYVLIFLLGIQSYLPTYNLDMDTNEFVANSTASLYCFFNWKSKQSNSLAALQLLKSCQHTLDIPQKLSFLRWTLWNWILSTNCDVCECTYVTHCGLSTPYPQFIRNQSHDGPVLLLKI